MQEQANWNGQAQKRRLRTEVQEWRQALSAESYASRSREIVGRMKLLPEIEAARTVHVYWPIVEQREVDVRPLIAWLYIQKKHIVLPVVAGQEASSLRTELDHRYFSGEDALVRNRWGILEPANAPRADLASVDVVIVPSVAVGRNGHRIGYGRGYYDQFLQTIELPRICPSFDFCLLDEVPAEGHDVPLSVIVTESEILRLQSS